jgi:hypothetical protein
MALNIWTEPSGFSLGSFPELVHIDQQLPVTDDAGVVYSIISGELPSGLFIKENHLFGSPYVSLNATEYMVCIRATRGSEFADRTFRLSITNIADPEFLTPAGELAAGVHHQFYVLDGSYVSYQIEAVDLNPLPNETLTFTIEDGNGVLPPGLTMSAAGLISGYIGPAITVQGTTHVYAIPYDFTVTITDGTNFNTRTFSIFVADPDAFRADSLMLDGLAGRFTSDSTYLQQPVWLTSADLGIHRANNYMTMPVGLYDKRSTVFRVEATNMEVYANTYQVSNSDNNVGKYSLTITNVTGIPTVNQYLTFENYLAGASATVYKIDTVIYLGGGVFRLHLTTPLLQSVDNGVPFYIGTLSQLPPGLSFDPETSEIYGRIPYQPAVTATYTFTITATKTYITSNETVTSSRTFTMILLGDITSEITWTTNSDLGILHANYVSTLNVNAVSNIDTATLIYKVESGTLPPGIDLTIDGELVGTVNQYYNQLTGVDGLITYDNDVAETTFDNNTTTFDRAYTFTVKVNDQYLYSTARKDFTVTIDTPNTTEFSNVYARPFLAPAQRSTWTSFITDASIFTPSMIYRPNDINFGVQEKLSMLVYAGIETATAATYVASIQNGFKRKRFNFGELTSAIATDPNNGNSVYEVVYVQMFDPLEPDGKHLPLEIAGGYYPNSISNWRTRISDGLPTERNYLPLWMRTIQPGTKEQIDYTLAIPLCYCKVGKSADIILNIKASGFDFTLLDYTIDRIVVDAVRDPDSGAVILGDKYLAFNNNRTTI